VIMHSGSTTRNIQTKFVMRLSQRFGGHASSLQISPATGTLAEAFTTKRASLAASQFPLFGRAMKIQRIISTSTRASTITSFGKRKGEIQKKREARCGSGGGARPPQNAPRGWGGWEFPLFSSLVHFRRAVGPGVGRATRELKYRPPRRWTARTSGVADSLDEA